MKLLFSILLLSAGALAQAKTVELTCQTKAYLCRYTEMGTACGWELFNGEPVGYVDLRLNAEEGVWRGSYRRMYDGHEFIVHLRVSDEDGAPVRYFASLSTPAVTADTSGTGRLDIGLHNHNYGRGFFCRSVKVLGE
jgi:hypothetical protein